MVDSGVRASGMDATYTLDDVAEHKSKDDCWIVVDGGTVRALQAARPEIRTSARSEM